jgi:hypothetical protein
VYTYNRVGRARFDCHHGVLDYRNRGRATTAQVGGVSRADARHIHHAYGVTSVRVVKRLIGNEAVHVRGFDPGIVKASLDAFGMKRCVLASGRLPTLVSPIPTMVYRPLIWPMASSEQMTSQDLSERDALLMLQHSITPYSNPPVFPTALCPIRGQKKDNAWCSSTMQRNTSIMTSGKRSISYDRQVQR